MEGATIIKPINKGLVHRISSGQVILDLTSAVKELLENSLDAAATSIEVSLKGYGLDSFQVIDNGSGISPSNFKVLALKHHTSKLVDFPDLQSLTTFGFRGEALSSLCALGDVTIETRTKNETVATHLTFDHSGSLISERKTARQVGTTVTVKNLFSNLPVRSKEFSRNIRKDYGKLISLLNAYAIIAKGVRLVCSNTTGKNAKTVVLKTQGSDSLKDNIITVFGMNTFSCLEPVSIYIPGDCTVDGFISKPGQGSGRNLGDRQYFFVNGRPVDMPKVSKLVNELYKGANSRQYPIAIMNFTVPTREFDVNVTPDKRKVFFSDENSILLALREGLQLIYSPSNVCYSFNKFHEPSKAGDNSQLLSPHEKSPMLLKRVSADDLDCKISHMEEHTLEKSNPLETFEIKRHPMDAHEKLTFNGDEKPGGKDFSLKVHGFKKANDFSKGTDRKLATHRNGVTNQNSPTPSTMLEKTAAKDRDSTGAFCSVQSKLDNFVTANKRKHEDTDTVLSEVPVLRNQTVCPSKKAHSEMHAAATWSSINHQEIDDSAEVSEITPSKYRRADAIINKIRNSLSSGGTSNDENPVQGLSDDDKVSSHADVASITSPSKVVEEGSDSLLVASPVLQPSDPIIDAPLPSSVQNVCPTLQFCFQDLMARRQQRLSRSLFVSDKPRGLKTKSHRNYAAASLELPQPDNEERKTRALAAATTELERFFRKEDFGRMQVIGQFNLGFIIGKIDQDLFIVDQHAADEKYNFERLCSSTILNQQPLLRPLSLELSPEEEIVVSMNMDIIRKNGFVLAEDPDAPAGRRFKLKTVPFSKNITFGVEDVKDLISTLADSQGECSMLGSYRMDTPDSICPPRVRAMLASRACRSSVMIGDPLGRNEMHKILEHLVGLNSPWNCPHGRPTMRHLFDLASVYKRLDMDDESL